MWRFLIVCVVVGMAAGLVRPGAGASEGRSGPTSTKRSATRPGRGAIKPGICVSLKGHRPFPPDNPWNRDISAAPVDPSSARLLAGIGLGKNLHPDFGPKGGIAYVVVTAAQRKVPVEFKHPGESDPGPYPVPRDAPIEGGPRARGDRHVLVVDRDNWKLYELFYAFPVDGGKRWTARSGAIFNLSSNKLRPAGWTSADAAGLPIFPGLVRYDEVFEQKEIRHAVRFTCRRTRRAYVPPATHWASRSKDPNLPPMGMRVRLKADYDIRGFPAAVQVILTGLKKYGMILSDNGGDFFITGAPDPRWDNEALVAIKRVKGKDLEVVKMENMVADR